MATGCCYGHFSLQTGAKIAAAINALIVPVMLLAVNIPSLHFPSYFKLQSNSEYVFHLFSSIIALFACEWSQPGLLIPILGSMVSIMTTSSTVSIALIGRLVFPRNRPHTEVGSTVADIVLFSVVFAFSVWFFVVIINYYESLIVREELQSTGSNVVFIGRIPITVNNSNLVIASLHIIKDTAAAQIVSIATCSYSIQSTSVILFPPFDEKVITPTAFINILEIVSSLLVFCACFNCKAILIMPILSLNAIKLGYVVLTIILCVVGIFNTHTLVPDWYRSLVDKRNVTSSIDESSLGVNQAVITNYVYYFFFQSMATLVFMLGYVAIFHNCYKHLEELESEALEQSE
ncbi:hypothetical protein PMAYCL1PPCAC_05842, partial [Pristionchus mayeri]